jgi:site-specific DNA recombinase
MSRTFAYLRVSTSQQKESGAGLNAQADAIHTWAEKNGVEFSSIIFHRDEGISGKTPVAKRPGLRTALYDLKKGDRLIVSSLCRLSRDLMTALLVEEELKKKKVTLISTKNEGTMDSDPTSILLKRVIQSFGEFERNLIAQRTSAALQSRKRRDKRTGQLPYGFAAGKNNSLRLVESEIDVLKTIDDLRFDGFSYDKIVAKLNDWGVMNRHGRPWNKRNLYVCYQGWLDDGRDRADRLTRKAS